MQLVDIISPDRVFFGIHAISKKRTLEQAAGLIAQQLPGLQAKELFEGLVGRERLGSTGIGCGVAIPHARMKQSGNTVGALIRLAQPVDFDAIDRQPVDLVFVLLVPQDANEAHLKILSQLAEMFSNSDIREALRDAHNADELYQRLVQFQPAHSS